VCRLRSDGIVHYFTRAVTSLLMPEADERQFSDFSSPLLKEKAIIISHRSFLGSHPFVLRESIFPSIFFSTSHSQRSLGLQFGVLYYAILGSYPRFRSTQPRLVTRICFVISQPQSNRVGSMETCKSFVPFLPCISPSNFKSPHPQFP
jgi:hypothetical protein